MSWFDFPRLHFSGQTIIDPATGNNNYHFPLVTYEPISGTVVLPPRIYLENEVDKKRIQEKFPSLIPCLHEEPGNDYIVIRAIDTPEKFKSWNISPLGTFPEDKAFHELYDHIFTEKEQCPLSGQHPGYWNYYGTLNFSLEDVRIQSVQLLEKNKLSTYSESEGIPAAFENIIGSSLSFSDHSGRLKQAVMIDVSPTLSLYSQVFCDLIHLDKAGQKIFKGSPVKASLRQMNTHRIISDSSITGSSGIFYSCIPLEAIEDADNNELVLAFKQYTSSPKKLKGICIRYDLYHVQENINPDYSLLGEQANPASSQILGTLSPWFENEYKTVGEGRMLIPDQAFHNQKKLGKTLINIDKENSRLSIDLIGTLPAYIDAETNKYQLYPLGDLYIEMKFDSSDLVLAKLNISDLQRFLNHGGIFDTLLSQKVMDEISSNNGSIYVSILRSTTPEKPAEKINLLKESPWRIFSDQAGLYGEEGDQSGAGFLSNHSYRENCHIQIYRFGLPYTKGIGLRIVELTIKPYGRGESTYIHETIEDFKHGQLLNPSMDTAGQKLLALLHETEIIPLDIKHFMLERGAFVNVRILPANKALKEVPENDLNFQLIYDEFLKHYDLIYPAAGIITPFNAGYLQKIHKYLKLIMKEDYWDNYLFMPSSRDLPQAKVQLLFRWLEKEIDSHKT
jgi:hypothetical protein